jgi:nucleolar protein 56
MKAFVVQSFLGVFGLDESGNIIESILYRKEPVKIAEKMLSVGSTNEEKELIDKLKKRGYSELISSKVLEGCELEQNNLGEKNFRRQFRQIEKKYGFSDLELNDFLTKIGIEFSRIRTKATVKKDRIVMQIIDAMDELDKSLNISIARLREWYGLHFPEMDKTIENHEKFAKIVSEAGLRDNIEEKELMELKKSSMGIELSEKDEAILKEYASSIRNLYKIREKMEKYLDDVLKEVAPNLRELAGATIAARLISLSGGLDKLTKKPSSTIQLLGAEKALFRFLHGRGRSPKYGLLFMHNMVQNAPNEKKGKIARVLASKLSIAAKMDYYGKGGISSELKKNLDDKVKNIMAVR